MSARLQTWHTRWLLLVAAALTLVLTATGCAGTPDVQAVETSPHTTEATTPPADDLTRCTPDPTVSFTPSTSSSYLAEIKNRGYLLVGVSADSRLLGAVDPKDPNRFDGFDITMARLVAKAALGSPDKLRFRVISAADRIPQLQRPVHPEDNAAGGVDLVARAITMDCDRWTKINFSAVYLLAHQGLLISKASPLNTTPAMSQNEIMRAMSGKTVCAATETTSLAFITKNHPLVKTHGVSAHTDCLVLLQQGKVDAITGDDAVLAGFRAQDANLVLLPQVRLRDEPVGLGVPKEHPDFAAFVNSVLAQAVKDGSWQRAYNTYFAPILGPATPPVPKYGR